MSAEEVERLGPSLLDTPHGRALGGSGTLVRHEAERGVRRGGGGILPVTVAHSADAQTSLFQQTGEPAEEVEVLGRGLLNTPYGRARGGRPCGANEEAEGIVHEKPHPRVIPSPRRGVQEVTRI